MKVHIIYTNYLTPDGARFSVGGIQTYLKALSVVIRQIGLDVNLYQKSDINFQKHVDGVNIYGYKDDGKHNIPEFLYANAKQYIDSSKDILIFGCETMAVKTNGVYTIGIQHGVFWDKPDYSNKPYWYMFFKKMYHAIKTIKRNQRLNQIVCVDYNFVNWYRSLVAYPKVSINVVPNFSVVAPLYSKPNDVVNIIFARRLFEYRGTRIFMKAIFRVLSEFENIRVTIAGEGPDEDMMRTYLNKFGNVEFIRYNSEDSLSIHSDKHIAVIPTVGSEGTSLSLLEAMSAQCAVVCSNVGGMTNIVIDQYNGLMINPCEEDLYVSIKELIINQDLRDAISIKAYETIKSGFSYENWAERWKNIILSARQK